MAAILRGEKVAPRMTPKTLAPLLDALITDRVVYFPIRHHSPACARFLERLIRDRKPQAILIEGPSSFNPLIPLILHPKTKAPFAIYTSCVEEEKAADDAPDKTAAMFGPPRHAAYYPFCDYSPELAALRTGAGTGASLHFIDLDYSEQIHAERGAGKDAPRVESLLAERHFKRSRYLQSLARRAGCRDHNDLWDHLFETRLDSASGIGTESVEKFIRDVASWCYFARGDTTEQELEADGTAAREAAMAGAIREKLEMGAERIVVVTGGFHTVVMPRLVAEINPASPAKTNRNKTSTCLIRYSFEQLDALNGYSAGMPSPYYYDRLWRSPASHGGAFSSVAANILVELGQLTRRKKLASALSPADEIAALEQARRLASMRGHPGPTREDLLDGIRSCFVKGSMDAEGQVIMELARHALGGTGVGEVPAEAGAPPIVDDFRVSAMKLRLNTGDSARRKTSLDLYRKSSHRRSSRFFHSLVFLDVPFAALSAGPDFVKGAGLERLFEHWSYQWTPQTESRLVEASVYGATVDEAAANRLSRSIAELEEAGRGRCAADAVGTLVHACRMGLHRHTGRLLKLIAAQVDEDPSLESLAAALNQLVLLWESREPLEAHYLTEIPVLIQTAYRRACFLMQNLPDTPADAAAATLQSLIAIRDLLRSGASENRLLDDMLFYEPLAKAFPHANCPAILAGGVTGLLHGDGRLAEGELLQRLSGSLSASSSLAGDQTGFLIGLLRACRELAWRQPALSEAVDRLLASWTEEEFVQRIPWLRLAFADLTPRESSQVAAVVSALHGGERIGPLYSSEISEVEMLDGARVNALVLKALKEDGLESWLEPEVPAKRPMEASS